MHWEQVIDHSIQYLHLPQQSFYFPLIQLEVYTIAARLSFWACEALFLYKEVNFPSSIIATGISFLFEFFIFRNILFSFRLINAGVLMTLELGDEDKQ